MRSTLVFTVFLIHVVTSDPLLLHSRVKRASSTCHCSPKLNCTLKYQIFPDHSACLPESSKANPVEITDAMKQQIVAKHNTYRGNVNPVATNMLKMTWDDELAMIAQKWTDACKVNGQGAFYHDKVRFIPGRFSVGQNIGTNYASFDDVIDAWHAEESNYKSLYGTKVSSLDPSNPFGHYTQLVWAHTSKIGCGLTLCDKKKFYVCNYGPAGNVLPFTAPYKTGTKCADCKTCDNGLCDCGDFACENSAEPNPKTCSCTCKYTGTGPRCQLNCNASDPYFCDGTQTGFRVSNCPSAYVSSACPKMCKVCPCADPNYVIPECNKGNQVSTSSALLFTILFILTVQFSTPLGAVW